MKSIRCKRKTLSMKVFIVETYDFSKERYFPYRVFDNHIDADITQCANTCSTGRYRKKARIGYRELTEEDYAYFEKINYWETANEI